MAAHVDQSHASATGPGAGFHRGPGVEALRLEGVTKRYDGKTALDAVTLSLPADSYLTLLGPSGSGKTVLLRILAGFETPDAGRLLMHGQRVDRVPAHRRGIGFVFQNFALFPHLNVFDNIAFGLINRTRGGVRSTAEVGERVRAMIDLVGLGGLETRGVHQISGGQRQRVALARTLVTEPGVVLLDEPLGALDANLRMRMRTELRRIRARLGVTFLHVTGNEREALAMGDRLIVLDAGRIGQVDHPDVVYNRPASANVARFLNCYNLLDGAVRAGRFATTGADLPLPRRGIEGDIRRYAIRQDLVEIRPAGAELAAAETGLAATFLASEYSGSSVMYFFALADGRVVEVENHLSHHRLRDYEAGRGYSLVWTVDDALVFG